MKLLLPMLPLRGLSMRALLLSALALSGCGGGDDRPIELPGPAAAAEYGDSLSGAVSGNVFELRVPMSPELLRGGTIWARGGPFFYLFSRPTQELFLRYPDLAGVRVVTEDAAGEEIARAMLPRGELSEFEWERALRLAAVAQQQGTDRPRRIEELIEWGEEHTTFEYSAAGAR